MEKESVDYLPNLGLKTPETEEKKEVIRQAAVMCVSELEKPNNFEMFKVAVINMFESFGIPRTDDPKGILRNETRWKRVYEHFQNIKDTDIELTIDLEMVGRGAYANLYFRVGKALTMFGKKRFFKIYPGACSLPNPIPKDSYALHYPEKNFYKMAEEILGVDIAIKTNSNWPKNPETITHIQDMYTFIVSEGKYKRIPVTQKTSNFQKILDAISSLKP